MKTRLRHKHITISIYPPLSFAARKKEPSRAVIWPPRQPRARPTSCDRDALLKRFTEPANQPLYHMLISPPLPDKTVPAAPTAPKMPKSQHFSRLVMMEELLFSLDSL